MPFGLTNAPASFQRAMDILLSPFQCKSCIVYLYDTIIFSKTWKDHFEHVEDILIALEGACVKLKHRKCELFVEKIKYLGHIVRTGSIEVDQARMAALREVKHPRDQTKLRSFQVCCNLYHPFFTNYAKLAHSLNQLLKKWMLI